VHREGDLDTSDNISDAGIRRDAIEREFLDLDFIEKSEIADRKRFTLGGGIQTVGVEVGDITTLFGVVISLHMLIVGRRISLGNGSNTTSQICFQHEICVGVCNKIQQCVSVAIAQAREGRVIK